MFVNRRAHCFALLLFVLSGGCMGVLLLWIVHRVGPAVWQLLLS